MDTLNPEEDLLWRKIRSSLPLSTKSNSAATNWINIQSYNYRSRLPSHSLVRQLTSFIDTGYISAANITSLISDGVAVIELNHKLRISVLSLMKGNEEIIRKIIKELKTSKEISPSLLSPFQINYHK
jgi:hypothetical protein